jgi:Gpi18-like mannosyltransferase
MFGLAFSFKQQALFLSPLLLMLLLSRRIAPWQLLIIPGTYLLMMVPAAMAGRPWARLLTIYINQADVQHDLSLNAPNPWWFLREIVSYDMGLLVGLGFGAAATLWIAWRAVKLPLSAYTILLIGTVSAVTMPWVLPKMGSRYFLTADLLSIGLAFVRPRLWPAAIMIPLGSLVAMLSYFTEAWDTATYAFAPMTFGLCIVVVEFIRSEKTANA